MLYLTLSENNRNSHNFMNISSCKERNTFGINGCNKLEYENN